MMGGCHKQGNAGLRLETVPRANLAVDLFGVADHGTRRGRGGHSEGLVERAKTF
jgi:hypothetical protein